MCLASLMDRGKRAEIGYITSTKPQAKLMTIQQDVKLLHSSSSIPNIFVQ